MIATVREVIQKLHQERRSCILAFQLERQEHLLKLYFRDGDILHLAHGSRKDGECLPLMREGFYKTYSYVDDDGARMPRGSLSPAEIMDSIASIDRTVASCADTVYGHSVNVERLDPDVIGRVEQELFEAVGPVAPIVLDDCLEKIRCPRGVPLSKETLRLILRAAAEDVPGKARASFLEKFGI